MCEVWKKIPDYDGYEASSDGRLRSYRKGSRYGVFFYDTPHLLKQFVDRQGRPRTSLRHNNGKRYTVSICRLILFAFRGSAPNGHEARHGNGNPADNRINNLSWSTHAENIADMRADRHGTAHKFLGKDNPNVRLKAEDIPVIRSRISSGRSLRSIGREFGVSHSSIGNIKKGVTWGYVNT